MPDPPRLSDVLVALDWLTRVHDSRPSQERLGIVRRYLMTADRDRPAGVSLHKIVIEQVLTEDGDLVDSLSAETVEGEPIPLTAALGMLRLAEDTVIRQAMGEVES